MESRGRSPPVHEFRGTFQGQRAFIRVTSVTGHVFSMDFPAAYQHWDAVEPVELFSAPVISSPEGKGGIVKHLEREAKGMDKLVLWLDCDREGENICFEVIRCVDKAMNRPINSDGQKIFRARFSAVTAKDIQKALSNLVAPNENESMAVEARQELDLKIGVAFSRFQTRYFQGKYGDLDSAVISYGPCQTPTLGFCVQRHDFINEFVPESFWGIDAVISVVTEAGSSNVPLEWSRKRLFDEGATRLLMRLISESHPNSLTCTSVNVTVGKHLRPQPMNTVQMLKTASKNLGIGPHSCMRAAEHLYLSGYLSYPRTESTSYPSSYDFNETLRSLYNHWSLSTYARELCAKKYTPPRQGHDAGDHPPITPVGLPPGPHALSGDELRLYDMIVRQFLASISPDETYEQTVATFEAVCGEKFSARGRRQLDPGYTVIYSIGRERPTIHEVEEDDEEGAPPGELPAGLQKGMVCSIVALKVRQGQTKPPGPLTESELISLMEKHGIGTDASIPTHINNIIVRNYVTLGSNRTLVPTNLGIVLVHGYLKIDPDLVLPDIRSAVETFCNMIAKGEVNKKKVVEHSLACFENKFRYFSANIESMDTLFESSFSPLAVTGKFLSKCGKCLRYMRYIPLIPQRLYCPNCEETYALPSGGTIKLYKETKCPLDKFELVFFSLGNTASAQGKGFPLCPFCYNNPPEFDELQSATLAAERLAIGAAEELSENNSQSNRFMNRISADTRQEKGKREYVGMGCNSCMNPGCSLSAVHNSICPCPHVPDGGSVPCSGQLVFDENSKPNWKLACNKCNTLFRFHGSVYNIRPLPPGRLCPECNMVRLMAFEFSKLKPLPNGDTSKTGCIVCDDTLNGMTEKVVGRSMNLTLLRQMRHKRGTGGRGRRGRGGSTRSREDAKMSFSDF